MFKKISEKYSTYGTIQIIIYLACSMLYFITLIYGGVAAYIHQNTPPEHQLPSSVGYSFTVIARSFLYGFVCIIIGLFTKFKKNKLSNYQLSHLHKIGGLILSQGILFCIIFFVFALIN